MITAEGIRNAVARNEQMGRTGSLANTAVDRLARRYLVRTELRAGAAWVELTHDRFIDPILQSNRAWFHPIEVAAQAWKETGKDPTRLYRGGPLADATVQTKERPAEFSRLACEFINASREAERRLIASRRQAITLVTVALTLAALLVWVISRTLFLPSCVDLLQNGGFESGWPPWIVPGNPIMPQIVTSPVFSGSYSAQFGSQTQNASSYSSAQQWVTIPRSHPRVFLQFWAYTWAQSLTGEDRQEVLLLAPGDKVMAVPWKVLQNQRVWQPHSFDLIGLAGQTFAVYLNVINDGTGGRTAMYVDDVYLWACPTGAYPPPMASATLATSTPGANITRVAVAVPTQVFTGTAVTPPASNWLNRIRLQEVLRWFLIAAAIVLVFLILLWLLRKLFGSPNP